MAAKIDAIMLINAIAYMIALESLYLCTFCHSLRNFFHTISFSKVLDFFQLI